MKTQRYILVFGFLLVMIFPLINNVLPFISHVGSSENRKPSPFPSFKKITPDESVKGLENYLLDRLEIRNNAIRFYNKLSVFVFRSSPTNVDAFIGKNGWLFFSGEELKTFVGTELFSENELQELAQEMKKRSDLLRTKYNAQLVMAIVPNKANIYSEFMPDHIKKAGELGYGEQVLKYLGGNGIRMIDLYQLKDLKGKYPLYYKTDNHWNDLGALLAGNIILKEFEKLNKRTTPLRFTGGVKLVKEKAGDIAKMLSVEDEMNDENYLPVLENKPLSVQKDQNKYPGISGFAYPWGYEHTRYTTNDSLPTVLIIRDSFGAKPFVYISERCKKCVAIFDSWQYGMNEQIVASEKPQILLYMVLESQLKNIMKHSKR
jgi:alginate O-acetyltransferase complex protein AlgJ